MVPSSSTFSVAYNVVMTSGKSERMSDYAGKVATYKYLTKKLKKKDSVSLEPPNWTNEWKL